MYQKIAILSFSIIFVLLLTASSCNRNKVNINKLQLEDLDGNPVNLSDYKDKTIVLNFWATWCPPCRQEKPLLEKARQELADEGFEFVMVSQEDPEIIRKYAEAKPYKFTYLHSKQNIKLLGIFNIPHTFLIDKNGKVVFSHNGMTNWASPDNLDVWRTLAK
jgi:thiol-disulfide isomerase/thioredoxin